jgi:hypothetical protein
MPTLVHFIPIFRPVPLKWAFFSYTVYVKKFTKWFFLTTYHIFMYIKTTKEDKTNQSVCNTHVRRNASKQNQSCMHYTYSNIYTHVPDITQHITQKNNKYKFSSVIENIYFQIQKIICLFRVNPPTIFFVPKMPTLVHLIPIFSDSTSTNLL